MLWHALIHKWATQYDIFSILMQQKVVHNNSKMSGEVPLERISK